MLQALKSFSDVKEGDIGGFVQGENNLSQFANCWIYDYAEVSGYASVEDNAIVRDVVIQDASIIGLNGLVQSTKDYLYIRGIGSKNRATTAYKTKDNIMIVCGCFIGALNEFKSRVHETHGGTDYEKEYNALIDIIKIHFNI